MYDGAIAPEHRADLEKSGITDETRQRQHIRSVPPALIGPLLGVDNPRIRSAMLLPFPSIDGGFMDHVRMKIFPPLVDAKGHAVKYLGPRGAGPRVYLCRSVMQAVLAADAPLWIVEGAKKALAVAQLGLAAVGIEGVEGWHTKGARDLLSDFHAIPLAGRIVELVPDGDCQSNPNVHRGVERLAAALRSRQAPLCLVVLPDRLEHSA